MSDLKKETFGNTTYRYSSEWIHNLESESHWRLYWNQQNIIKGLVVPGDHIFEIGVGSGFTANYLKSKGYLVTTIDIDAEKQPDIIANIATYPFDLKFDALLAFEVFEHIPFDEFKSCLWRIRNACQKYVFLSLPRNEKIWMKSQLELPLGITVKRSIGTLRRKIITKTHFWEIDHPATRLDKVLSLFSECGFRIIRKAKVDSILFFALQ